MAALDDPRAASSPPREFWDPSLVEEIRRSGLWNNSISNKIWIAALEKRMSSRKDAKYALGVEGTPSDEPRPSSRANAGIQRFLPEFTLGLAEGSK